MEFLRRRIGLILQVLVSVLIIAWLTRVVDWAKVWVNMQMMSPGWIVTGLICFAPVVLIVSYRWRMLLAVHGIHLRFWRVLELTMIGQFFGTIGLGTTGGDVAKVFYAARAMPTRKAAAAFTIIVDRVIGLIALLLFGAAMALSQWQLLFSRGNGGAPGILSPKAATSLFFLIALGGVCAGLVASAGPYLLKIPAVAALVGRLPLGRRGNSMLRAYEATASALGTNILALIVSIPSHACSTLMGFCVIRSMGLSPDPIALFAIIAMVNMLIALPVSLGGIGFREGLYVGYLGLLNIPADKALAFSLTCFAMSLFWSLAGGPFYYLYRHETHTPPPTDDGVDPIYSE